MAVITQIHCTICGQNKQECRSASDYSSECQECKSAAKTKAERTWKAGREGLTLEERIRDIENFIYHHSRQKHYEGPIVFG